MLVALQALPLLVLLGLLLSGRAGPIIACLMALVTVLPAATLALPNGLVALPRFLSDEALRGAFLALAPIGVVTGGLLFHAAVADDAQATPRLPTPARIFAVTLPLGAFLESVTGFAVGAIFALGALRGMGIGGAVAGALALQALTLVPWGGLGPGTALGAALAGLPADAVARVAAWPSALWLIALAPLLWSLSARAGVPVPARERGIQAALLAAMAMLLIAANAALPFELAGVLAAGPVAAAALWRADPPRSLTAAWTVAWPYLALVVALLGARLWPAPPAFAPFAGLPAFPLTHVAVVLWLVALALLARRGGLPTRAATALRRARKPALVMLLYVVFGRVFAGSGAASGLAVAAAEGLGPLAPYAVPSMALLAGIVTGSNIGANAALMPVQVALGAAAGLPPALAPGIHNFAGGAGAGMSIGVLSMLCAVLADGTKPAAIWRLLAPSLALVLALGAGGMALLR